MTIMNPREVFVSHLLKYPKKRSQIIGNGFENDAVTLHELATEEPINRYVDKEISTLTEARRVMEIYTAFREAGLPVASFAKIVRKKIDGELRYFQTMEDLTEGKKYRLTEIIAPGIATEKTNPGKIIDQALNSDLLRRNTVRCLAIIHNLGYFNFHPPRMGSSFFLKEKISAPTPKNIDLCILDYANFTSDSDPAQLFPEFRQNFQDIPNNLEEATQSNLEDLLLDMSAKDEFDDQPLRMLYDRVRGKKITTYLPNKF